MEPGKKGGRACIRGMRIAVSDVLGWLASGMTVDEIIDDYPDLTSSDISACLAYTADRERFSATNSVGSVQPIVLLEGESERGGSVCNLGELN